MKLALGEIEAVIAGDDGGIPERDTARQRVDGDERVLLDRIKGRVAASRVPRRIGRPHLGKALREDGREHGAVPFLRIDARHLRRKDDLLGVGVVREKHGVLDGLARLRAVVVLGEDRDLIRRAAEIEDEPLPRIIMIPESIRDTRPEADGTPVHHVVVRDAARLIPGPVERVEVRRGVGDRIRHRGARVLTGAIVGRERGARAAGVVDEVAAWPGIEKLAEEGQLLRGEEVRILKDIVDDAAIVLDGSDTRVRRGGRVGIADARRRERRRRGREEGERRRDRKKEASSHGGPPRKRLHPRASGVNPREL